MINDPLEYVIDIASELVDESQQDAFTKDDVKLLMMKAERETRQCRFRKCYVRDVWERGEYVYTLWNDRYKHDTTKTKNDIYKEIAFIVGDITPSNVRHIITKIKRKDPDTMKKLKGVIHAKVST